MLKPNLQEAILELNKNAKFRVYDSDVKKIQWLDGTKAISESKITSKLSELKTTYEKTKETKEQKIKTDKNSAIKKLKDLGLTDDEITALTGNLYE